MIQWLRSLLFTLTIYTVMVGIGIVYLPWALLSSEGAAAAARTWAKFTIWLARVLLGIKVEIRGTPPTGDVMIAAKHQSFLDILIIYAAVPRARFIMKKELTRLPIFGQYALRMGCIPVDRGRKGAAIRSMLSDVAGVKDLHGQLVIYPQGTRTAPYEDAPYKKGTAALYLELKRPCVPVACNVGLFWPRKGLIKHPGTAVIEFLPMLPANLPVRSLMAQLEAAIEPASDRLMAEAGHPRPALTAQS